MSYSNALSIASLGNFSSNTLFFCESVLESVNFFQLASTIVLQAAIDTISKIGSDLVNQAISQSHTQEIKPIQNRVLIPTPEKTILPKKPLLRQVIDIHKSEKLAVRLFQAVLQGHVEEVEFQLEQGANPNAINLDGETSLFHAVSNDKFEIAKLLIDYGADVPHALLKLAVAFHSEKMTSLLLEKTSGSDAGKLLFDAASRSNLRVVKFLLDLGVDVDTLHEGQTLLHYAIYRNSLQLAELLLDYGADVTARDIKYAARRHARALLKLLITRGRGYGILNRKRC